MRTAALLVLTVLCQAAPDVEHYTLSNGLRVILHVNPAAPNVHVQTRFRVGAKYERPGRTGFAHLFEHMLGQGVHAGVDSNTEAEAFGASGVSGTATHDYIEMYATVPTGALERMLWLESGRLALLAGEVTQANLDRQREIVRNERRQKVENSPYGRVNMLVHDAAFPYGHPYGHDVIGSHADLIAATLDDLRSFHAEYFTPGNVAIVLTGAFEPVRAKEWIAKHFGSIPPGRGVARPARWSGALREGRVVEVRDRVPQERTFVAWPGPPRSAPDFAALEIALRVLVDAGGRFFEHSSDSIAGEILGFEDTSLLVLNAAAEKNPLEKIEELIDAEIATLAKTDPTEQEMARARNGLEFEAVSRLETPYGFAVALHDADMLLGSPTRVDEITGRHRKITAAQVREAVARWIATPNRATVRFRPEKSTGPTAAEPDRKQPPAVETSRPYTPPAIRTAKLANGVEVLVVEMRGTPKVSVRLRLRVGAAANPAGKDGLGLVTMTALERGPHSRAFADLGAKLVAGADFDSLSLGLDMLTHQLKPVMRQFASMVLEPDFKDKRFANSKRDWLDHVKNPRPGDSLDLVMRVATGRTLFGSPESLQSITEQDAASFHARYIRPDVASLTFAGDVTLEDAVAAARESFGGWKGSAGRTPVLEYRKLDGGRLHLTNRPAATQSHITMVLPGIARRDPRYVAHVLSDRAFGGMFSSRLNLNLRQGKGITYFVASEIGSGAAGGVWFVKTAVEAGKTKEALSELLRELLDVSGARPLTAEELEHARAQTLRAYPERFEAAAPAADSTSQFWSAGLPASETREFPAALAAVTLEQANAVMRDLVRPGAQVFLIEGDRAVVEQAAKELGLRLE